MPLEYCRFLFAFVSCILPNFKVMQKSLLLCYVVGFRIPISMITNVVSDIYDVTGVCRTLITVLYVCLISVIHLERQLHLTAIK